MVREYWRKVARRASCEALGVLHITSRDRVLMSIASAIVVLVALTIFGSTEAAKDHIVAITSVVAFIALVFPAIFLWKLLSVPALLHDEGEKKIGGLEQLIKPAFGPERISVVDLAAIAKKKYGWTLGISSLDSLDFLDALRQYGADGKLGFDGREGAFAFAEHMKPNFPLREIPPAHFQLAQFDVPLFFEGTENYNVSTYTVSGA